MHQFLFQFFLCNDIMFLTLAKIHKEIHNNFSIFDLSVVCDKNEMSAEVFQIFDRLSTSFFLNVSILVPKHILTFKNVSLFFISLISDLYSLLASLSISQWSLNSRV